MIVSRISSKSQVTLPKAVRTALRLHDGDRLQWTIMSDGDVRLQRLELDYSDDGFVNDFSLFTEWADELDSAYDRL